MCAFSTLELLSERGLRARIEGGQLRIGPSSMLDDDLRDRIRQDRDGLVEILTALESRPDPLAGLIEIEPGVWVLPGYEHVSFD